MKLRYILLSVLALSSSLALAITPMLGDVMLPVAAGNGNEISPEAAYTTGTYDVKCFLDSETAIKTGSVQVIVNGLSNSKALTYGVSTVDFPAVAPAYIQGQDSAYIDIKALGTKDLLTSQGKKQLDVYCEYTHNA